MIQFLEPTPVLVLYAALVAGLLVAELKENRSAQRMLKPAAAIGFILIALQADALRNEYGRIFLVGLLACAIGDVFLLSRKSPKLFLAGMVTFALGHIAYIVAFLSLKDDGFPAIAIAITVGILCFGLMIYAWLQPHLPRNMRVAVRGYILIIFAMVISSLGLPVLGSWRFAIIGAFMFAISDIFVARDRFVSPDPRNAFAITPLYFGAQALIALSTHASF